MAQQSSSENPFSSEMEASARKWLSRLAEILSCLLEHHRAYLFPKKQGFTIIIQITLGCTTLFLAKLVLIRILHP
jgi:hypothetical protein